MRREFWDEDGRAGRKDLVVLVADNQQEQTVATLLTRRSSISGYPAGDLLILIRTFSPIPSTIREYSKKLGVFCQSFLNSINMP